MQAREKVGKSRNTVFLQWLATGQMRDEKLHAVVARSTFRSQKCKKTDGFRAFFGSWDVEKVHAVVAWSTFQSQNARNAACSDHFWRFRCGFAWQAQGIMHLAHFGRWQPCEICSGVCKDNFRVAIAIQATCSSEMLGGCGADFLRGVCILGARFRCWASDL